MRFEWDEKKNSRKLVKHRISFEMAKLVFSDPHALSVPERVVNGEERWQTLGRIKSATIVLVAHTYREENGDEVIRIIPSRKATAPERRAYEEGHERSR